MKITLLTMLVVLTGIYTPLMAQHHSPAVPGHPPTSYRVILQQVLNDAGLENREVKMMIVDYPPNGASVPHRHPCPTFGYVLEGEIESVFEGKTYHYKAGDSFYEASHGLHGAARNKDLSKPARLLVFFIAEKGKPTTIPEN